MNSHSDLIMNSQVRTYDRATSVVFRKTNEEFGGLSNMAGGFPLGIAGLGIRTAEALYQACRFPHLPEVQRLILEQASPMAAKMMSKPYRIDSRPDWHQVRVTVMRWCIRVKLAQNWQTFGELLLRTGAKPIVEESRRDPFWGAKPTGDELIGLNVLGRLLMELRDETHVTGRAGLHRVQPPAIPDFLLDGHPIGEVDAEDVHASPSSPVGQSVGAKSRRRTGASGSGVEQRSLFEQRSLSDWLLPTEDE